MKKFLLGFVAALALVAIVYFAYPLLRGFSGDVGGPLNPSELTSGATAFGNLNVRVTGKGKPLQNIEVDLGTPGGRMSYAMTGADGVASFSDVAVGRYTIFFNDVNFPKEYARISSPIPVQILKDETTEQDIELVQR